MRFNLLMPKWFRRTSCVRRRGALVKGHLMAEWPAQSAVKRSADRWQRWPVDELEKKRSTYSFGAAQLIQLRRRISKTKKKKCKEDGNESAVFRMPTSPAQRPKRVGQKSYLLFERD